MSKDIEVDGKVWTYCCNVMVVTPEGDRWTYPTYLDPNGTQRYAPNPVIRKLVDIQAIDLNDLAVKMIKKNKDQKSAKAYLEFNMALGYSVCGLCDFHKFWACDPDEQEDMDDLYGYKSMCWELENPQWKKEEQKTPA